MVDLNYNFECDWFIQLTDNKLSNNKLFDNNLTSELVKIGDFKKKKQSRKFYFFMIYDISQHKHAAWHFADQISGPALYDLHTPMQINSFLQKRMEV